ncbi:MAG: hypothetical protein D6732_17650 [Methanobacteriota archaeon]|nr:MAG: hypothetical protein D6732_17650 [Euryarchaeota archaeon]
MLSIKHITGLFFIGILVISGVAPVLADTFEVSNTAASPLVVQFGDSVEELAAIAELKSNFLHARIVDFSEHDTIISYSGPVIYVAHSSDKGILYHGKTVSWYVLAGLIRNSKSDSHYMLGCDSNSISEILSSSNMAVVSFSQKIDAILGAIMVSALIKRSIGETSSFFPLLLKLFGRISTITQNPESFLPLYLGGEETYTLGYIFFTIFAFLFPLTNAALAFSVASFAASALHLASYLYDFVVWVLDFVNGKNPDPNKMTYTLYKLITGIVGIVTAKILKLVWWKQPMAYSALNADTAKNAIASVATVILTASALAGIVYYLTLFTFDFIDADTTYW